MYQCMYTGRTLSLVRTLNFLEPDRCRARQGASGFEDGLGVKMHGHFPTPDYASKGYLPFHEVGRLYMSLTTFN